MVQVQGGTGYHFNGKNKGILEGRYNVAFDDIKYVAYPALRHRFFLNFDGMSEGITTDDLIGEIIKEIERQ